MINSHNRRQKFRIPKGQGKARLIKYSKELFLENGYESTSPQDIYKLSGVGQGSFYHHFSSKADLMKTVLDELYEAELHSLNEVIMQDISAREKLNVFLNKPRTGKKGCKFGRFVYESSVVKSEIGSPIKNYFKDMERILKTLLEEGQDDGSITQILSAEKLSQTVIAQIQGGYILSRVKKSDAVFADIITSIKKVILID